TALRGVERVVVVPHGPSHGLPWVAALQRAGWEVAPGAPVAVVTLPALGVLRALMERPEVRASGSVVVGDPRQDLVNAEHEARVVAGRLGAEAIVGPAATREAVTSKLAAASLIHFATHAEFDAENPLDSHVVLADGVWTVRDA